MLKKSKMPKNDIYLNKLLGGKDAMRQKKTKNEKSENGQAA